MQKALITFFILFWIALNFEYSYGHTGYTASASASATIMTPASITKDSDMEFGKVSLKELKGQSIVLQAGFGSPAGSPAPKGQDPNNLAASFIVSGESSYLQALTLPRQPVNLDRGGHRLTLSAFTASVPPGAVIAAGPLRIDVGASMSLSHPHADLSGLTAAEQFEVILHNN